MKKLSACLLVVLFLASMVAFYAPKKASADPCTTVTMNPSQQDSWMYWGSGSGNGTTYEFSVDIVITNVTDMGAWQFGVFWNNNYLNCDSAVIRNPSTWENNTLSIGVSNGVDNAYNSTNGYFCYASAVETFLAFFSGTVTVATLTFHQLANVSATTPLNFDSVELTDSQFNDIAFSSTDGSVVMHVGVKSTMVTINGNGSTILLGPWPSNWANWQCAQSNDGDTSYVYTGSSGSQGESGYDLYNASSPWIPSGATNVTVSIHIIVRSTSAFYKASFAATINATSTGYKQAGSFTPSTSYQEYSGNFTIATSDGVSLQIGVYINPGTHTIRGMINYYDGYCTEVYAVITWS
jgi:hypothetical protein